MRFRKKAVEIDAVEYLGPFPNNAPAWIFDALGDGTLRFMDGGLAIRTLEGIMSSYPGDWIIRGIKGEIYSCKADIFEQTYEPVINEL